MPPTSECHELDGKLAQFFISTFSAIIKHTIFLIKGVTIFRRYPELFRESDVRIFWNVSVIINETVKEYVSHRLISPTRSFLPENSPRSIFVLLSKKHRSNGWRSHFIAFVYNIWQVFLTIFFVCHSSFRKSSLANHMEKQGEIFPPDNKIGITLL